MVNNLSKTVTLFLIVFVLGTVLSGAISVRQAIQNTDVNLRGDLPTVAIVEMDIDALHEHEILTGQWPEDLSGLSPQTLEEIGALPYVRNFDYSVEMGLLSDDLERYAIDDEMSVDMGMGDRWTQLNIKGVRSANFFELEEEVIELVSGRSFEEHEVINLNYVALVSQNFARMNNLHIGSTFTLQNIVWDMRGVEEIHPDFYTEENIHSQRSYDFEVIGTFISNVEFNTGDEWMDAEFENHIENRIYVSNIVSIAAMQYQLDKMAEMNPDETQWQEDFWHSAWIQNIYTLYNPNDMSSFAYAVERVAPEFYTVTYTSDIFGVVASSIKSLENLSLGILWGATIAAIFILSLLITLLVRERKHEMGILLALGERKRKVILQVVFEVLTIALIAVTLALLSGSFISGSISESMFRDSLVAGQIADTGMTFSTLDFMGFSNNVPLEEVLASYDTSLTMSMIVTFFAIAAGIIIVSTIAPTLYILRLNPRKIMM